MILPGHIAGGYLATNVILSVTGIPLSGTEHTAVLIIGTLAGELPDIDLIRFYIENHFRDNSKPHRSYFTHAPIFWLLFSFIISIIGTIFNSVFIGAIGLVIATGTLSHFILDSIEYGIMWLWPASTKHFFLIAKPKEVRNVIGKVGTIPYYWDYISKHYIKNVTFYAEIFIVLIAIVYFLFNL